MAKLLISILVLLSCLVFFTYQVHADEDVKFYNQYNRNDLTDYRNTGKGYWLLFILKQTFGEKEPLPEWATKTQVVEVGKIQYITTSK